MSKPLLAQELLSSAPGHHLPQVEDDAFVSNREGALCVLFDQEDRQPALRDQRPEASHDLDEHEPGEAERGLIEEEHPRASDQSAAER